MWLIIFTWVSTLKNLLSYDSKQYSSKKSCFYILCEPKSFSNYILIHCFKYFSNLCQKLHELNFLIRPINRLSLHSIWIQVFQSIRNPNEKYCSFISFLIAFAIVRASCVIAPTQVPATPNNVWVCVYVFFYLYRKKKTKTKKNVLRRFDLQYYTCGGSHATLTVDTRARENAMQATGGGSSESASSSARDTLDIAATPLEKLIHSKWEKYLCFFLVFFQNDFPVQISNDLESSIDVTIINFIDEKVSYKRKNYSRVSHL